MLNFDPSDLEQQVGIEMDSHLSDEDTPQNTVKPKGVQKVFSVPVTEEEIALKNEAFESPASKTLAEEFKATPHKQVDTNITLQGNSSTQVPLSELKPNEEVSIGIALPTTNITKTDTKPFFKSQSVVPNESGSGTNKSSGGGVALAGG